MVTDAKQSDPFKMTTVALLIVSVVMALVFSTRSMNRTVNDRDRMKAARDEVAAVAFFLEDGDLPNAVVALHDIGLRLAPVEGAEDAALAVSEAVQAALAAHEKTKSDLEVSRAEVARMKTHLAEARRRGDRNLNRTAVLETVRDRNALILGNMVSGQFGLAKRLLAATPEKNVVAAAAERLLGRLTALDEAAAAAGSQRSHGLRALARVWPVPGVQRFAKLVGAEETRNYLIEKSIAELSELLGSVDADLETARMSFRRVLQTAGVPEAEALADSLARLKIRRVAEAAEKSGDLPRAVAGYRIIRDEAAARRLQAQLDRDWLIGLAVKAVREKRPISAGDLFLAAHETTGDPKLREASDHHYAEGWLTRAQEHLDRARFRAAAAATDRAGMYAPETAAKLLERVKAEFERFQAAEAASRAQQALDAGAAGLAATILGKHEVPLELRTDVEIGRKEEIRRNARVALYEEDGKRALALLASIEDTGALYARANLLAGDVEKGLTGQPRGAEIRSVMLLHAAWTVLDAEPARAARIGLAALTATGARPATLSLLRAALDRAGEVPVGDKLWDEVKAVIFAATSSLPGEK